jgi:hypothetical protein
MNTGPATISAPKRAKFGTNERNAVALNEFQISINVLIPTIQR